MAVAANIVIADGQATPVNRTYIPVGPDTKDPTIFIYEDQSNLTQAGFWRLTVQVKRPPTLERGKAADRSNRVVIALHQPVLETLGTNTVTGISPAPTVSYITRSFSEFVIPERAAALDRKNIRVMQAAALSNAQIILAIESLLPIY